MAGIARCRSSFQFSKGFIDLKPTSQILDIKIQPKIDLICLFGKKNMGDRNSEIRL